MLTTVTLTLAGKLPAGVQVGDELRISGVVTVHSIVAPLVDTSTAGHVSYLAGATSVAAYGNEIEFAAVREP